MPPVSQALNIAQRTLGMSDETLAILKAAIGYDELANFSKAIFVASKLGHLREKVVKANLCDAAEISGVNSGLYFRWPIDNWPQGGFRPFCSALKLETFLHQ